MSKPKPMLYGEVPAKYWKTGKQLIVKIQKPLMGDEVMIYDETRDWNLLIPMSFHDEYTWDEIFGTELKVYWKSHFAKNGQLVVDEQVEEQAW